jgi:hypothetical protein
VSIALYSKLSISSSVFKKRIELLLFELISSKAFISLFELLVIVTTSLGGIIGIGLEEVGIFAIISGHLRKSGVGFSSVKN